MCSNPARSQQLLTTYHTTFCEIPRPQTFPVLATAVADGIIYVVSFDNNLYALNADTGSLLWKYNGIDVGVVSPAVVNGVVYVTCQHGEMCAFNSNTGILLWSFPGKYSVTSSPAVANGVVYFGAIDQNVYALDAGTGNLLWTYHTGNAVNSSPSVANGLVYVGSDDGNVYAFGVTSDTGTKDVSAEQEAASNSPDLRTLRPDFNLKVSEPVAKGDDTD